jgi:alpha-glucoside transport system substrate-binding protein
LRLLAELWTPRNIAGGIEGALSTTYENSVQRAFGARHAAVMVMEGDFVESAITGDTNARLGVDVDVFGFPGRTTADRFVVGGGDAAVMMRRSPAAAAFIRFLATPQAATEWAAEGGFVSPNLNVDLSIYPDPISRTIARSLVEAGDDFRFDLSDLQPVEFGGIEGRGMRGRLQHFLATGDVDATAAGLEADAAAAYR